MPMVLDLCIVVVKHDQIGHVKDVVPIAIGKFLNKGNAKHLRR